MRKPKQLPPDGLDTNASICYSSSNTASGEIVASSRSAQEPAQTSCVRASIDFQGPPKSESKTVQSDFEKLTKADLIALLHREPRVFDDVDLHFLYRSTLDRLKVLGARAREGKCVDETSEFSRWVKSSGLTKLFERYPASGQLEVSAEKVRTLAQKVLFDCECYFNKVPRGPWVELSELESINQKLDRIAGGLAMLHQRNLSPCEEVETASAGSDSSPALRVLAGGWNLGEKPGERA
jgi:hypothetical protein